MNGDAVAGVIVESKAGEVRRRAARDTER
jgi:hypothetical protein